MPTATLAQIKEIEDLIKEAQKHKKNSKKAKDTYVKAIKLADKYFKIPLHKNCLGEPVYDPDLKGGGVTDPVEVKDDKGKVIGGKGRVRLGPGSFIFNKKPSAIWLAAAKVHEMYGHCANGFKLESAKYKGGTYTVTFPRLPRDEDEVISYNVMLDWAKKLGLTETMIKFIKACKKYYFKGMPKKKQDEWRKKEPWLGFRMDSSEFDRYFEYLRPKAGAVLVGRNDKYRKASGKETFLDLAKSLTGGDLTQLLDLNPKLNTPIRDIRYVAIGPPEFIPPSN